MRREKLKRDGTRKSQSTDAGHGGRDARSRDEGSVMELDRRCVGGSALALSGPTLRRRSLGREAKSLGPPAD